MINKKWFKVEPVVIVPNCIKSGRKQDCFNCGLQKANLCDSPRAWCVKSYHGHKKGCPNYGKNEMCPPNCPMFNEIYDMNKDIYAIIYEYDIKSHMEKMKEKHPHWTDLQLRNVLYWQGTAKKEHKKVVQEFLEEYREKGYEIIAPEPMGIDVNKTLEKVGIKLEWPPENISMRVAIAAIPLEGKSITNYCSKEKNNDLTCYYNKKM